MFVLSSLCLSFFMSCILRLCFDPKRHRCSEISNFTSLRCARHDAVEESGEQCCTCRVCLRLWERKRQRKTVCMLSVEVYVSVSRTAWVSQFEMQHLQMCLVNSSLSPFRGDHWNSAIRVSVFVGQRAWVWVYLPACLRVFKRLSILYNLNLYSSFWIRCMYYQLFFHKYQLSAWHENIKVVIFSAIIQKIVLAWSIVLCTIYL